MANAPRSSFIPKQVTNAAPKKVRHTRVFSIFAFIAGTLLFISLLLSGGIYVYKGIEQSKLERERAALASERERFDEQDIAEVRSFNRRIELAETLLDGHISPSKIFDALEMSTKQSVQYTSFIYARRPSGDVSLDLTGVTDDFAKVALQAMQNSEDFILKGAAVTEVGVSSQAFEDDAPIATGVKQVNFQILANVPASKLLFEPNAMEAQSEVTAPPVVGTSTTEALDDTDSEARDEEDLEAETSAGQSAPTSGTSTPASGT